MRFDKRKNCACQCASPQRQSNMSPQTHAFPSRKGGVGCKAGVSTKERSSLRTFAFLRSGRQLTQADGPMSGPHPCTDALVNGNPGAVAFRSDHQNRQRTPTRATGPRQRAPDRPNATFSEQQATRLAEGAAPRPQCRGVGSTRGYPMSDRFQRQATKSPRVRARRMFDGVSESGGL